MPYSSRCFAAPARRSAPIHAVTGVELNQAFETFLERSAFTQALAGCDDTARLVIEQTGVREHAKQRPEQFLQPLRVIVCNGDAERVTRLAQ